MSSVTPDHAPLLRTDRLTLEPVRVSHAVEMLPGLSDPGLYRYLPDQPPSCLGELEARYRRWAVGQSPDGADLWCNWIVRHTADGRCVGTTQATLTDFHSRSGRALIGYMILPTEWRRGFGREAVTAMLDCLFDHYGCLAADALVDTRNTASLALLIGLGFTIDGLIPDADFFDGAGSDEYALSLERS